jgi:predicted O-linked N-acetylglucosamine transferase (SPINDLY family)
MNRLMVFAQKAAPVQVTFAGYPGTTGLSTIDYRLTDPYLDPPGRNDEFYCEKSIRLPRSFWCFDPAAMGVAEGFPVSQSPAKSAGHFTFGCLNNFCKVNPAVLKLWARVLQACPDSHLLLRAPEGNSRRNVLQTFESLGIARGRIEFVDSQPHDEYFRTFNRIDLSVDTFPYGGHTTTLDSLWMGVPVVSLVGSAAPARAGLSILTNAGLPELAAATPEDFVRIATEWANDPTRLEECRSTLRPRLLASPLTDAKGFTAAIESAYRQMWRDWCTTP